METNRVYFVRNGESVWNSMNLFCGWHDVELSEKGMYQIVLLTSPELLKEDIKFEVAYTSLLKRAIKTLEIIMNSLHLPNIKMHSAWQLNERHYGALTGFNKRQMANLHGEEKIQIWRRSYDVIPPPMTPAHAFYKRIRSNPKFQNIPNNEFPDSESLEMSLKRVIPYWENCIVPDIKKNKKILIVTHGTTLRAIVKHIENMDDKQVMEANIPNAIPFSYNFDIKTMKVIGKIKFHAEEHTIKAEIAKAASIGY